MHSSLSINTLCFLAAPLTQHVAQVAALGARGISPDLEQVEAIGAATARRLFADAGLDIATLTHRAFGYSSPAEMAAARERLARTIDLAAAIGAHSIIMTTGGRGGLSWGDAAQRFAEAVAPCAVQAQAAGISLGIEPTSHLYADVSIAHRLTDCVHIARQAGISVMIDLFACWCDADIDAALAEAGPATALVQVSDYFYGDRGLPCRAVPGDGAIPLASLIPAIMTAGFRGYFDLEIIGPRLHAEGAEQGLRRAGVFLGKLLEDAGLPGGRRSTTATKVKAHDRRNPGLRCR
jgi:sugar phosphate isomerase/epimerase